MFQLVPGRDGSTGTTWYDLSLCDMVLYSLSRPYLTEAGPEALTHAQFLSGVYLPYCEGKPHPQFPHPLNEDCLVDSQSIAGWMEGGSLAHAFGSALSHLLIFEQTIADSYHG